MGIGSKAWGQCAKSGKRMLLDDMVEDGYYPGLLVHPDWYEPPTEENERVPMFDKEFLDRPAPSNDHQNHTVRFPLLDFDTFEVVPPLVSYFYVSRILSNVIPEATTNVGTFSIGDLSINNTFTENGNAITSSLGVAPGVVKPQFNSLPMVTFLSMVSLKIDADTLALAGGQSMTSTLGTVTINSWGSGSWGSGAWGE